MKASTTAILLTCAALGAVALHGQQTNKPFSPRGTAATQVAGTWTGQKPGVPPQYPGGKWIEVDYGRPILRGRKNIFGSGADYGKTLNAGAPVWRAGADSTTKLTTEVPIAIRGQDSPARGLRPVRGAQGRILDSDRGNAADAGHSRPQ